MLLLVQNLNLYTERFQMSTLKIAPSWMQALAIGALVFWLAEPPIRLWAWLDQEMLGRMKKLIMSCNSMWIRLMSRSIRKHSLNLSFEVMLPITPGDFSRRVNQDERMPPDCISFGCLAFRTDDSCWAV